MRWADWAENENIGQSETWANIRAVKRETGETRTWNIFRPTSEEEASLPKEKRTGLVWLRKAVIRDPIHSKWRHWASSHCYRMMINDQRFKVDWKD